MSRIEQIEDQVRNLSGEELREFRQWLDEFEADLWDDQLAADSVAGRIDSLMARALADEREGNTTPL